MVDVGGRRLQPSILARRYDVRSKILRRDLEDGGPQQLSSSSASRRQRTQLRFGIVDQGIWGLPKCMRVWTKERRAPGESIATGRHCALVSDRFSSTSTMGSRQQSTEDKDVRIEAIRTVLNLYPFSIGMFREILQNSEDAKASKQVESSFSHTFCSTY